MNSRFQQFLTLIAVTTTLGGCEPDRTLAPRNPGFAKQGPPTSDAPSNLSSTIQSQSEIILIWQDNSSNESGFEVHRSTTGQAGAFSLNSTTAPNVTSFRESGLVAGREYCYKIRASGTKGKTTTYSSFSNVSCATTSPLPAPSTTVQPEGSTSIYVSWVGADNSQNRSRIERASTAAGPWTAWITMQAATGSITNHGLTSEQQMCYRVIAVNNSAESAPSNVDCTSPPAAPTNLAATPASTGEIDLTWTDQSMVEEGYEVRRSGIDEVWTAVATVPPNAVRYRDGSVNAGSRYQYAVLAIKDGGYSSSYSNVAVSTPAAVAPNAPTDVTASPGNSTSINVSWYRSSESTESFRIERSTDGQTWLPLGNVPDAWHTGYYDPDRVPEQRVCYRVFAVNSIGESAPSVDCTTPPMGPTGLVIVVIDAATVEVRWADNSAVEDGYEVWVNTNGGRCWDNGSGECVWGPYPLATLPPNTTSYRMSASEEFTAVMAVKDEGYSDPAPFLSAASAAPTVAALRAHQLRAVKPATRPRSADAKRRR